MMTKDDKRAASVAAALVAIGVVAAVSLTLCASSPQAAIRSFTMGYSTGPELFNGMCKNMSDLLNCSNCCMVNGSGMPIEEREKCIDLCIDKFGVAAAYDAVISAAKTVRDVSTSDYVHFSRCRNLLKMARHSVKYPRLRALADGLCRQLNIPTADPVQS